MMATTGPTTWEHFLYPRAATGSGSHRSQNSSISTLLSSLIPFFAISAVLFLIFLISQKFYDRVYAPRTYLDSLRQYERTPQRNSGLLGFRKTLQRLSDEFVLEHSSIDNYLCLRFFKMLALMCFVGCLITWPVLFPVNATGGGGQSGLDILSFSNSVPGARYFAHCFIAWVFLGFVMFLITRETLYFVQLRQAYFLSPYMTSRISSKTVLFLDVPESHRDYGYLRHIFPQARTIWIPEDVKDLQDHIDDRDGATAKLEAGESALIQNYIKKHLKAQKKAQKAGKGNDQIPVELDSKDRPTHRTKPIIGKKVDTINWSRGELQRLVPQVIRQQEIQQADETGTLSAVFIEFESVAAAQHAFQASTHRNPFQMTPVDHGMTPDDVIWKNLNRSWWLRKIINWASTGVVVVLCIWWTIPVAFVGALSNIDSLTQKFPWLSFLNAIPPQILGVVTGLLPTVLLVILMALVPILCNKLAGLFEPTQSAVQLRTQAWYFPFQVLQVFLITTFSSGAAAVGQKIAQNPTSAATLLAQNLPTASNFYLAYFVYFGLLQAAVQILNLMPLLFFVVIGKITDKTPRKKYNRYTQLAGLGWGAFYPKFTNLGVIALSYSIIAPLVLGFATITFAFLYLAFRYNMFFTLGTTVSTRGRAYARAMQQLTTGIYLSELCLIGLFIAGSASNSVAVGPLILMIIFLIGTVLWHAQMRKILGRLTTTLPTELLVEEYRNLHGDEVDQEKAETREGMNEPRSQTSNDSMPETQHSIPETQNFTPEAQYPISAVQNSKTQNSTSKTQNVKPSYQIPQPQTYEAPPAPTGIMGRVKKFFMPTKYASSAALSKHILSPHLSEPVRPYTAEERRLAYLHPALVSECPVVWIPKDTFGMSKREIADTRKEVGEGLTITDEGSWIDENGNIEWDTAHIKSMPVWEERVIF